MKTILTQTIESKVKQLGLKRQGGFTFTEILIVLAIIAGVTVLVLSQAGTVITSGSVDRASADVRSIVSAAQRFRATRPNYAGLSITDLNNRGLLPDHIGTGVGTNPWAGNYEVGSSATNDRVVVVLTGVPDGGERLSLTDSLGDDTACGIVPQPVCTGFLVDGTAATTMLDAYVVATGWGGMDNWGHAFE